MLRSSLNASRLFVPRTIIGSSTPQQVLVCNHHTPINNILGSRSMAVAANANSSDAPLITPGTPISTPTLIDIDRRWLDLTAQQQLDIFKALHEREKEPWYTMTTEERKACTSSAPSLLNPT
jgi:Cytochrome c oxidase subunit IV